MVADAIKQYNGLYAVELTKSDARFIKRTKFTQSEFYDILRS
jgi:hypothetical protein